MKPHRPQPWTTRQLAVGGLAAVLFFAVLFTVVALVGTEQGNGGAQVPDEQPAIEVDVDHHRVRHSPQVLRSSPPARKAATPRAPSSAKPVR